MSSLTPFPHGGLRPANVRLNGRAGIWTPVRVRNLGADHVDKAKIAADCGKAYVSALGKLFEGESIKSQAEVVKQELQSISSQCKAAFAE